MADINKKNNPTYAVTLTHDEYHLIVNALRTTSSYYTPGSAVRRSFEELRDAFQRAL